MTTRRWPLVGLALLAASAAGAAVGPDPIPIWPGEPPGGGAPGLSVLRVYPAPAADATGTAIVVCPGGAYWLHAMDHEGHQVARWLNGIGVAAFVLSYRLSPHPAPLQDAQRALRWVRSHAGEYGVAPDRVGIMGFSAGGHLASTAATHFDPGDPAAADPVERESSRPDFAVLGYPVISLIEPYRHDGSRRNLLGPRADDAALLEDLSNERRVTPETPPTFLFHTAEDAAVPVENSLAFFAALKRAGVPAELHVYQYGNHGVGLAPGDPVLATWTERLADWLRTSGLLVEGERFGISGRVSVGGEPLALGSVTLEPDDAHAPVTWGAVWEGKFQIPASRGPVAGAYRVVVRDLRALGPEPTLDEPRVLPAGRREVAGEVAAGDGEWVLELPAEER